MPSNALQSILAEAGLAIAPLRTIDSSARAVAFFRQLGYDFAPNTFGGALAGLAGQAGQLITAVRQLVAADEEADVAVAIANVFTQLTTTVDAIRQLHEQLQLSGGAIPNIADFPRRLTDFLILDYFERQKPDLHAILHLLGLIEHEPNPAPGQSMRLINWERFGLFLTDPQRIADNVYQWNDNFDAGKFLTRLETLMRAASLPGSMYPQADTTRTILGNSSSDLQELRFPIFQKGFTPETYTQFGITFSPSEAQGPNKKGIALLPYLMGATEFQFAVCDRGELIFQSTADIRGIALVIRPPFNAEGILNLTGAFRASLQIREKPERADEIILVGSRGGGRLAIQGLSVSWFIQNPEGRLDLGMEAELQALRLVIAGGEGDGFLQKILSGLHVEAEANFGLGFTLLSGFVFRGGARLAIELSTHIDLGPLQIDGLRLALAPVNDHFDLEVGALLKLDLGPLKATVQNIGLKTALQFHQGNVGPVNLDISFKPPNGVGLSVDSGVVRGGGFLSFDPDNGEYLGALELSFQGWFDLKAIGIINTRMPDGSSGFSLLIIITAEFTPIQLGFGFVLIGVGGLLGLHRTTRIDMLREGIKTNALRSILFPQDVVANIARIVSDIKQVFPPQVDHFIIGPMAKIGWGSPAIITLEVGLLLELPVPRIAILGVLKAILPNEEAELLKIQINFLGVIDFENKYISFDASLYDSRLLVFTLTGDMAFRLSWGDNPLFILSVGGFHPAFRDAPADLQHMTRLTISLLSGENPRITIQCYFAVTSNTVQFGAKAELYAEAAGFNVYGFLGFDVLFQFDPFHFIASLYAGLALRIGTSVLMGIRLSGELSGPTPWDVRGEASISILFFDITVGFHETWGERPEEVEAERVNLLGLLTGEVNDIRNWKADIPDKNNLHVTIKTIEPPEGKLIVHPFGVLTFSERLLPLRVPLAKFGNKLPQDANRFELSEVKSGSTGLATQEVKEQFAPAHFFELSDDEKVSHASFDLMTSGFKITASASLQVATPVSKRVDYELSYLRKKKFSVFLAGLYQLAKDLFKMATKSSAVAKASLSYQSNRISSNAPEAVVLRPEQYGIANVSDLRLYRPELVADSYTEASLLFEGLVREQPELKEQVQILASHELERSDL